MSGIDTLAGQLSLQPGRPPPNIVSTRRLLAPALAQGRPASALPEMLAGVFALCGDAHRLAARQAIAAAGGPAASDGDNERTLQLDTLREQVRRIWLDWPPALAGSDADAADIAALRDCPLLCRVGKPDAILAATPTWLAEQALGGDPASWLSRWEDDPSGWLAAWCRRATTLPARLLRGCEAAARRLATAAPMPLRVHADLAALAELAAQLRADAGFALQPRRHGLPWETGPWTRLNEPAPERFADAWLRLGARLAEVVRLALPDVAGRSGAQWLRHGALGLAPGEGLAWCEMARGLLVHRIELDGVADGDARVVRCDVLAPTEWNFHPAGPVAQALAATADDSDDAQARLLAAAFDPCVAIRIEHRDA
jgi:hypothetical protein